MILTEILTPKFLMMLRPGEEKKPKVSKENQDQSALEGGDTTLNWAAWNSSVHSSRLH